MENSVNTCQHLELSYWKIMMNINTQYLFLMNLFVWFIEDNILAFFF